jgi:hypothetical protein
MKFLFASSALAAAFAIAPAYAQQAPKPPVTAESTTEGTVTVEGVEPSQVLGAIDTSKLVDQPAPADEQPQVQAQAKTQVTVDETTVQTADAKIETKVETITPVSDRPKVDPETPIAPEVQAVVESGKKYTTADIVLAQLEAIKNTPPVNPTTTITTTTTTPTPG